MSATLRQIVEQSGKLYSCVAAWIGSYSTAAAMWKPACSKPSDRPPAPAKRSTPIGFSPLRCIKQELYRMLYRFGGGCQPSDSTSDGIAAANIPLSVIGGHRIGRR